MNQLLFWLEGMNMHNIEGDTIVWVRQYAPERQQREFPWRSTHLTSTAGAS
jgi:hypothetical protein